MKLKAISKHGKAGTVEYSCWGKMKTRCHDPNDQSYARYGGRGIAVCDRWRESFENFFEDMGFKPSPRHSIERKNNNGPYCKENCTWATRLEQNNNTSQNRRITFGGQTMTLAQWGRSLGLNWHTLNNRLRRGWSLENALTNK